MGTDFLIRPLRLPPVWVLFYLGSILAANVAGSSTDTVGGANVEHVFLGGALGFSVLFLLFDGNFSRIDGLDRVLKYLALFGLAIFLGLLSSIHPGPRIVGASTLIYWCGLVASMGVAALAALRGHTKWVLAAIVVAGIPLIASIVHPFFPSLGWLAPVERLNPVRGGRISGVFWNPNTTGFALYCSFAACLCLYHSLPRRSLGWLRWGCLGLGLSYAAAVSLTISRGSILIMLLTAFVFLYSLWRRAKHRSVITVLLVALVGATLYRAAHLFDAQQSVFARVSDTSLYEGDSFRLYALQGAVRRASHLLLLGEGTSQFVESSHIYLEDVSLPQISIYRKAPHNQILGIWVEWGFLAVSLLYAAHAWMIIHGVKRIRQRADDAEFVLLAAYFSIVLYQQFHEVNSPASCALLGLYVGASAQGIFAGLSCGMDAYRT